MKDKLQEQCYKYWPTIVGDSRNFDEFNVQLLEEHKDGKYVRRVLRVTLLKASISVIFNSSDSDSISDSSSSPSLKVKMKTNNE